MKKEKGTGHVEVFSPMPSVEGLAIEFDVFCCLDIVITFLYVDPYTHM